MVDMNVGLKPTNDPNYTNSAKEASRYDFNNSSKYENLYQGLINSLKTGVENADATVKGMIKSDVYEGVDKLRGAQGVDLAADNPLTPLNLDKGGPAGPASPSGGQGGGSGGGGATPVPENAPPNPEGIKSDYQRLQAAYSQGKISDTHYYAQLETMNRALRSRYPGYRDEVDAMVASVTGVTPANALRKAVLSDLNTAASNADAVTKQRQQFIKENLQYLDPSVIQREATGNPYSLPELWAMVQPKVQDEAATKNAKAKLELEASKGAATSTTASQAAIQVIGGLESQLMSKTSQNGVTIGGWLDQRMDDLKNNKVLSPDEENKVKAQFLQFKTAYQNELQKLWNDPLTPGSKHTLASALNDPNRQKSITDQTMAKFDLVEKALNDKDFGLLKVAANAVTSMQNADSKAILEKYPTVRALSAIAAMPGMGNVLQNVISTDPKKYGPLLDQLSDAMTIHNITGGKYNPNGPTSINDDLKSWAATPGGNTPAGHVKFVRDRVNELTNPALPVDQKITAAQKIFSDDNIQMLNKYRDAGSRNKVFSMLVSPEVTKNMMAAKDKDPKVWDNYSKWALNSFSSVYRQVGNDMNDVANRPWIDIKWNPSASQFEVSPTAEGTAMANKDPNGAGGSVVRYLEGRMGANVTDAMSKINSGIKLIEPILKANGFKPNEEIPKLTQFINLKDGKNNTFWQTLVKASSVERGTDLTGDTFGGGALNFTQPSGEAGGKYSTEKLATADSLKDAFSHAESSNDYNRLVTPTSGKYTTAPLTDMTIAQVLQYQNGMRGAGFPSTAAGKFQIIQGTLKSLVDEGVVKLTDKYSPENQERLAEALLERRGMSDFMAGKISHTQFIKNLGNEWEAIKRFPDVGRRVMSALKEARD